MIALVLLAFCALVHVHANTQMINFRLADLPALSPLPDALVHLKPYYLELSSTESPSLALPLTGSAYQLHALNLSTTPASPLPAFLDSHLSFGARTIRLSWPASHPTSFSLSLHSPSKSYPSSLFILIEATYTGVPLPRKSPAPNGRKVPFALRVEPLWFGVLPETAGPLVGVLLGVLGIMWAARIPQRVAELVEDLARGGRKRD